VQTEEAEIVVYLALVGLMGLQEVLVHQVQTESLA
jgi:hypothetical protein